MNLLFGGMSVCAGVLLSVALRSNLTERRRMLRAFRSALAVLENAICYLGMPVSRAMHRVDSELVEFFSEISESIDACTPDIIEVWKTGINKHLRCLNARDRELLLDFAALLGQSDTAEQRKLFASTARLLELQLGDAEQDMSKKGKLYKTLGFAAGAIVAIMIM